MTLFSDNFLQNTCKLVSSPFGEVGWGFFFSVCKGKQLYSESNRFLGYWSNKFRKYLCNYLFYREISKNRETPTASPDPSEGRGVPMRTRGIGLGSLSDSFLQNTCELAHPLLSEGLGEAVEVGWGFLFPITQSQSQNHKKDFQCVKRFLYNIIPY